MFVLHVALKRVPDSAVEPDDPKRVLSLPPSARETSLPKSVPSFPLLHHQVLVNLEDGVGVSLVNKVPEELVFATLSGIDVHFTRTAGSQVLEMSVQKIQVLEPVISSPLYCRVLLRECISLRGLHNPHKCHCLPVDYRICKVQ